MLLEKHKTGVHEDLEIFCHYFNNNKDCPFDDQCVYLHEDSEKCKFGRGCERKMCMYKHEECDESDAGSDDENDDENEDADSDDEEVSVDKLVPILEKVQEAVEKFDLLLKKNSLMCKECDFEARNQNGLNMHVKAKHTKQ